MEFKHEQSVWTLQRQLPCPLWRSQLTSKGSLKTNCVKPCAEDCFLQSDINPAVLKEVRIKPSNIKFVTYFLLYNTLSFLDALCNYYLLFINSGMKTSDSNVSSLCSWKKFRCSLCTHRDVGCLLFQFIRMYFQNI